MRQPCVEASPECVKGVLDGLGVPEYGYRLLGIVHDDKPALHARFSAFRPFLRLSALDIYSLVSCACEPVDVPFTCVVGQFADTPPVFRTFAERENGIAVFVLGVVFGEVRRLPEIGRRLSQLPEAVAGGGRKAENDGTHASGGRTLVRGVSVFRFVEFGDDYAIFGHDAA